MDWLAASQVTAGLIWSDRSSPDDFDPNDFHYPYNDIIKKLCSGQDKDTLMGDYLDPIQEAIHAEERVNGLGNGNWSKVLLRSKRAFEEGEFLSKAGRSRQAGKDIDWDRLERILEQRDKIETSGYANLGEVQNIETPLIRCGYYPIDYHMGGIPIGLITLGGRPKVGKTTFAIRLAGTMAMKYKKYVLFHSLEMRDSEIKFRFREIFGKNYPEIEPYILINHDKIPAKEIRNKVKEAYKQFGDQIALVVVDSIDKALEEEISENSFSFAYDKLHEIPKIINAPTLAIAHLKKTSSGIPRTKDLRYSRMATADAAWVAMLYNPNTDDTVDEFSDYTNNTPLQTLKNQAYIISWMTRFGVKSHPNSPASKEHPGAIRVPYHPVRGWLSKKEAPWHSLQNSL